MSQAGVANIGAIPPPPGSMTDLEGQDSVVVPPNGAGILFVKGAVVAAGSTPFTTTGDAGTSTETWNIQISQALAATDATKIGLSNFNSAQFSVDANGFVSLLGTAAVEGVTPDAHTAPGTSPVLPNGSGNITVTGGQVAAGTTTNVIRTDSLAANTYTIQIQRSQAVGSSTIGDNGVSHFNSSQFTVDANGFVGLTGSGTNPPILGIHPNAISGTGTDPTVADASGNISILGAAVAAGTNPVRTVATTVNSLTTQVQISQAIAATDATKIGLSNFNSAQFTVDANGFVGLKGSGTNPPILGVHPNATSGGGTDPTVADASGNISILAATVAAGTNPIRSVATAVNSITMQAQLSQAIAAADATKIGLANFNSAFFTVDANAFVSVVGTALGQTITGNSGGALSPTAGNWNILGASTAAGTSPVTTSGAASTLTVNVQKAQAIASTDATKVGLSNFNSAQFTVDANGFVSLSGGAVGETITGDSGGALSPTAGNWNILGRSGSKTSGSGSTLTVNSPPFSQVGASATSVLNSGEFVTAAVTRTLPATAGLLDGDLVIYYCTTSGALVVTANTGQTIRIGTLVSSSAGTATSTAIGDSVSLRWDATAVSWRCVSVIGTWVMA